jgi:two-component system response regulator (stage 0 sporulation protein F)
MSFKSNNVSEKSLNKNDRQFLLNNHNMKRCRDMNEKILIVDDQYGIRILLNEVFQKAGYQTFQAANGFQALEIVDKHKPDLVLLDMKIPGMDGIEILKRMRVVEPDIRVIIMTAYGELDMIQEAKDLGALTHFAKPFDIDEIRDAVRKYLPIRSN